MGFIIYAFYTPICWGWGGGLLGDLILGHKPIVAVECDPYACAVLRERSEEGWFPGLYVHEGDVRLFDPSEYAGKVDCVHAGFPCQDISTAGRGEGITGKRSGLVSEVFRVIDVIRPQYVFLENSPAIRTRGRNVVLGELVARGYAYRDGILAASDVGANHRRNRWWCLANSSGGRCGGEEERQMEFEGRTEIVCSSTTSDSMLKGLEEPAQGELRSVSQKERTSERGKFSGTPTEARSYWFTEPKLDRVAHGVADRVDRIKAIGNGQVPLQAATAWCLLGGPRPLI